MRGPTAAVTLALLVAGWTLGACAPAAGPVASPTRAGGAQSALEVIRAKKTLTVAVRVEEPQGGRTPQDPAHRQKRAFELGVATLLAQRIIGPDAKLEVRSAGGDRVAAAEQGQADLAFIASSPSLAGRALFSDPYAGGAIVVAVPAASTVARLEDLAGKTVSIAQDELRAQEVVTQLLAQRGVQVTTRTVMGMTGATTAAESGETAAAVGDSVGLAVIVQARPGSFRTIASLEKRPAVVAVRSGSRELLAAVNIALRALLAEGAIRAAAVQAALPYEAP